MTGFEQASSAPLEVHVADGSSARADMLLPHIRVVESGIAGIIGKVDVNQRVGPRLLGRGARWAWRRAHASTMPANCNTWRSA